VALAGQGAADLRLPDAQVVVVIWFERRVIGRMQQRPGPTGSARSGILQTLADGLKLR
jgi:NADH-quinone oxidoreductase subunit H